MKTITLVILFSFLHGQSCFARSVLSSAQETARAQVTIKIGNQLEGPTLCPDWDRDQKKLDCITTGLYVPGRDVPEKHQNNITLKENVEKMIHGKKNR